MNQPSFENLVGQLVEVLHRHVHHHRNLLAIVERRKKAPGSLSGAELSRLFDREREAILALGATDAERLRLCGRINVLWGRPAESPLRLVEIVQLAGEDHRDEILDLREEMRELADEIELLNGVHRSMAVHSLDHIHLCVAAPPQGENDLLEVEHARPHP